MPHSNLGAEGELVWCCLDMAGPEGQSSNAGAVVKEFNRVEEAGPSNTLGKNGSQVGKIEVFADGTELAQNRFFPRFLKFNRRFVITAISIKLDYLVYFLLLNPMTHPFFKYDKPVLRHWRFAERPFV